jgi:SAM-dependent methyltransferase
MAIREMYRILKPNGTVILAAPLFWHLHEEPRDFFRYTKHGFTHLLKCNGFEVQEIIPLSGFWVTFIMMFLNYMGRFNKGIIKFIPIIPMVSLILQPIAFLLNKVDYKGKIWTWPYIAVGRKKSALHHP